MIPSPSQLSLQQNVMLQRVSQLDYRDFLLWSIINTTQVLQKRSSKFEFFLSFNYFALLFFCNKGRTLVQCQVPSVHMTGCGFEFRNQPLQIWR